MNPKLPYYMAYPMPLAYDDEKTERRDFEYMKSLYPSVAKKVLPYIEDECDRMEYDCSMMYDDYPDKLQLRMMCNRIYQKVCREEKSLSEERDEYMNMYGVQEQAMHHREHHHHDRGNGWLNDLIEVMVYQELYKRRCDNRRCRRKFY